MQKFLRTLMLAALMLPFASQAQTLPFSEGFGTAIPTGWSMYTGLASNVFNGTALTSATYGWSFGGNNGLTDNHARVNIYGTSCNRWLVTPSIALTGVTNPQLSFELAFTAYSGANPAATSNIADDKFMVIISTDDGATWNAANATVWMVTDSVTAGVADYDLTTLPYASFQTVTIDLTSYLGSTIKIAFYGESTVTGGDNNLHIDNVYVGEPITCFKVSGLAIDNTQTTTNSLTLTWNDTINTGATYTIYNMLDTTVFASGVTGISYTATGLTANTGYLFAVMTDCGGGDVTELTLPVSGRTVCESPVALPYVEGFNGYYGLPTNPYYGPSTVPGCWDFYGNGTNTAETTGTTAYYGGVGQYNGTTNASMENNNPYLYMPIQLTGSAVTNSTYLGYETERGNTKYAILPDFGTALSGLQMSFDYKMSTAYSETGAAAVLELGYVTGDTSTFVAVASFNAVTSTQHVLDLSLAGLTIAAPQGARLAFKFSGVHNGTGSYSYSTVACGIDNIRVEVQPNCARITNLTVAGTTTTSITLSWVDTVNNATYTVSDADGVIASGITGTTYTVTGLTANTEYTFSVVANCSATDASYETTISGRTACEGNTIFPWSEDFEDFAANSSGVVLNESCWMNEHISGGGTNLFQVYSGSISDNATNKLRLPDMAAGTQTKLTLPAMAFPTGTTYLFTLDVLRNVSGTSYPSEGVRVFASTDGQIEGATELGFLYRNCTQTDGGVVVAEDATGWYTYSFIIPEGTVYIILRGESSYGSATYMDNFVIDEAPNCMPVTGLTSIADGTTAIFVWSGSANSYTATLTDAEGATVGTPQTVTDTTASFTDLTVDNDYTVSVVANCGNDVSTAVTATVHIGYCSPNPTSVDGSGITSVSFGGMTNTTHNAVSGSAMYEDFTTMAGSVPAGTTASVDITYATGYDYGTIIWVDWNNNMSFEGNEVVAVGTSTSSNPTTLTLTFDIPATQALGNYRMRIVGADSYFDNYTASLEAAANANPCASFTWGVAEDYTLTVTEAPSCLAVTGLTVSDITAHGATMTWNGNGAPSYDIFDMSNSTLYATATDTTYTFANIPANGNFTVGIVANCSETDHSDTALVSFSTPCEAVVLPYTESFEATSATRDCWNFVSNNTPNIGGTNGMMYVMVGNNAMWRFSSFTSATDYNQYGFSPALDASALTDADLLHVRVRYGTHGSADNLYFGYIDGNDTVWDETAYYTTGETDFQYYEAYIPLTASQLAVHYFGNYQYYAWIDSVEVTGFAIPPCVAPANVTFVGSNESQIGITWEGDSTATYAIFDMADSTLIGTLEGNEALMSNLTPNTPYTFGVATVCFNGYSDTVTVATRTACSAIALPFVETFEETSATINCWTTDGPGTWSLAAGDYSTSTGAFEGSQNVRITHSTSGNVTKLVSPALSVSEEATALQLSFAHIQRSWSGDQDEMRVYYRTSATADWTMAAEYTDAIASWTVDSIVIPANTYQVAFEMTDGYGYGVAVDSVVVNELTTAFCFPANSIAAEVTTTSATLTWSGNSSSYQVTVSDGTTNVYDGVVNDTTLALTSLTAETNYTVSIYAICGVDDTSDVTTATFFTGYCSPNPTSVDGSGITSVSFGGMTNTTHNAVSGSAMYENFSTMAGSVPAGTIASVDITYATGYTYGTIIWVDWNNNMSFEGNEVVAVGTSSSSNPTTLTLTFDIPATQALGNYRMRIVGADSYFDNYTASLEAAANANPCASYSYGVAEDYTLTVTEAPSCLAPADVAIEYIGGNTNAATISWISNASSFNLKLNGVVTYGFATASPATITGLDANTEYTVMIQADCGNGDTSAWSIPVSLRTPCGMITELPWSDGMEEVPAGSYQMPYCWSRYNNLTSGNNYYPYSYNGPSYAHEGNKSLYWYFSTDGTYPDTAVAILPELDVTTYPMNGNQLSFYARMSSATTSVNVVVGSMSDPEDISTFVASDSITVSGVEYTRYDVNLTSAGLNDAYAAIMVLKPSSYASLYIDDVTLHEIPSCSYVTDVVVDSVTNESVTISWQDLANQGASYSIYNGDELVASNISTTTYTVGNLTANTTYTIGVVANCPAGDAELVTVSVHTACSAIELPYTEDFSATTGTRDCWTLVSNNTINASTSSSSNNYMGFVTYSGHDVMVFNSWSTASDYYQYGYSPLLDASTLEGSDSLHVRVVYSTYGSADPVYYGYTTTGSTNPSDYTWVGPFYTNGYDNWSVFEANLPMTATRLAVHYASTTCSYKAYIDSLVVTGYTTPVAPDSVSITFAVNDATMGTTNPAPGTYNYAENSTFSVTAIPNEGYHFANWQVTVNLYGVEYTYDYESDTNTITDQATDLYDGVILTAIFEADSTPVNPVVPEATIAASEILYWVGEGNNEVVLAVNWADSALAWGYRFSEDSVMSSTMMSDIMAADPRFSYTLSNGYLNNITFVENGTTLAGNTNISFWESKVNGSTDNAGMYEYLHNGDFQKWANSAAGIVVDSMTYVYEGDEYTIYINNYPMTIYPVSVPVVPCSNVYDTTTVAACDSYVWYGDTLTQGGIYNHTQAVEDGCDSIFTLVLTVNQSVNVAITDSAEGSYVWNNQVYAESGVYTWTGTTVDGCDSTVVLTLTVSNPCAPVYGDTTVATACDSYLWIDTVFTESGLYNRIYELSAGCDSIVTLNLTLNYSVTENVEVSDYDSVVWNDTVFTESTVYTWNGTTVAGCDSTVIVTVTVLETPVPDSVTITFAVNDATMGTTNPAPGTYNYAVGDVLTITAVPNEGYHLAGWQVTIPAFHVDTLVTEDIDLSYTDTVDMLANGAVFTAVFAANSVEPTYVTINALSSDTTMGIVTGAGEYEQGATVTLVAIAKTGYRFVGWSNGETDSVLTFTATEDMTITANFERVGIDVVEGSNATVYSAESNIYVKGAENLNIYVYDVNGRCVRTQANAAETVVFTMPNTGVYLVKVGNAPAKRVVVVR